LIPTIEDVETLDFLLVIKGSLLLEYNETDQETGQERFKILTQHKGYIHPIRNPDNQYIKCVRMGPEEEMVVCLCIERLKFRKILFSVSFHNFYSDKDRFVREQQVNEWLI
jgi:hypothetical protein